MSTRTRKRSESYTNLAVDVIRDRILDLTLEPGKRIDDKLLMEQFGLSKTPIREALNRLATDGLIDLHPNRGAYVRPLDLDDVRQFFEAYITSERTVGYLCNTNDPDLAMDLEQIEVNLSAARAERNYLLICTQNADFHLRLAQAMNNTYIYDFCAKLHRLARRISLYVFLHEMNSTMNHNKYSRTNNNAHNKIIQQVRNGDNVAMIDNLTSHAMLFRDRIVKVISQTRSQEMPIRPPE